MDYKMAVNKGIKAISDIPIKKSPDLKIDYNEKSKIENELNIICQNNIIDFLTDYIRTNNIVKADTYEDIIIVNVTKNIEFNIKTRYEEKDGVKHYYHCAIFGKNYYNNYNFKIRNEKTKTNVWSNIRKEINKLGMSVYINTYTSTPNILIYNTTNVDFINQKINENFGGDRNPFHKDNESNELWHGLNNWIIKDEPEDLNLDVKETVKETNEQVIEIPIEQSIVEENSKSTEEDTKTVKDNMTIIKSENIDELYIKFNMGIIVIEKNTFDISLEEEHYINLIWSRNNECDKMEVWIDHNFYKVKRFCIGGVAIISNKA
jgi:hypothetical protein